MINLNPQEEKWNQWFAGVTDGDGCFYMNPKEKKVSYEMTTHSKDVRVLKMIQNKLNAGSVKLKSGVNAVRYRIKQKSVILQILARLNGKLHNPVRLVQFKKVCELYNIEFIEPSDLIQKDSRYLSGLIDSDGSFTISVSNSSQENSQISGVEGRIRRLEHSRGFNQLRLRITSSHQHYLEMIQKSYHLGKIRVERANLQNKNPNPKYHLIIESEKEFQYLYEYLKKNPLNSVKMHRMRLIPLFFKYKQLKYHLHSPGTIEFKIWSKFAKSWYKHSY